MKSVFGYSEKMIIDNTVILNTLFLKNRRKIEYASL